MRISNNYIKKRVDDEDLLIPLNEQGMDITKSLKLNEVGSLIYDMINGGNDKSAIVKHIMAKYNVSKDIVSTDFDLYVEDLIKRGVIIE